MMRGAGRLIKLAGLVAVAAAMLGMAAAPAQAAPPSVPGGLVLTPGATGAPQRAMSVNVAWVGSIDTDGVIAGYVIEHGSSGGALASVAVGPVTGFRLEGLVRGVEHVVRVTAIDDAGERSAPAVAKIALPALAMRVRVSMQLPSRALRSCSRIRGRCTIDSTLRHRVQLRAAPRRAVAGTQVLLDLQHRAPGGSSFRSERRITVTLGPSLVAASVKLGSLVRASGTWCIRARVIGAPDLRQRAVGSTCIRYRPPVEIGWAGDIVIGSHYGLPPQGGAAQFAKVAHLLKRPDLMIGNYEGTLSRGGVSRCSGGPLCFIFQAPPERARNLRIAGFDVMNLANNHGLDKGEDARRQTVQALTRAGIASAGLPGRVTVQQIEDTRVAIVGMSPYPGTTNMRSTAEIHALVKAAKRRGDIVVMAFHAGLEGARGAHVPRGQDYGTNTRAAVHAAVDAGADVVFGSGPHVVRGVERYRGSFIIYSSGNFAGWHNFRVGGLSSQSGVVRVTLDHRGHSRSAAWDGVIIDRPGIPRPDRTGAVVRRVAALSKQDFGRNAARFSRDGRFR
ncbi:MAG: CapA family protein [Gaiellales bacterium]